MEGASVIFFFILSTNYNLQEDEQGGFDPPCSLSTCLTRTGGGFSPPRLLSTCFDANEEGSTLFIIDLF